MANGTTSASLAAAGTMPHGSFGTAGAATTCADSGYSSSSGSPNRTTPNGIRYSYQQNTELQNNGANAVAGANTRVPMMGPIETTAMHPYRPAANGLGINGFSGAHAAALLPSHAGNQPPSSGLSLGAVAGFSGPLNLYKAPISAIAGCNGVSSTTTPDPNEHCSCAQCSITTAAILSNNPQQLTPQPHGQPRAEGEGNPATSTGPSPVVAASASHWSSIPITATAMNQRVGYGWTHGSQVLPPSGVVLPVANETANQLTSGVSATRHGRDALATNASGNACSSPEEYYDGSPTNMPI